MVSFLAALLNFRKVYVEPLPIARVKSNFCLLFHHDTPHPVELLLKDPFRIRKVLLR